MLIAGLCIAVGVLFSLLLWMTNTAIWWMREADKSVKRMDGMAAGWANVAKACRAERDENARLRKTIARYQQFRNAVTDADDELFAVEIKEKKQ